MAQLWSWDVAKTPGAERIFSSPFTDKVHLAEQTNHSCIVVIKAFLTSISKESVSLGAVLKALRSLDSLEPIY